MPPEPPWYNGVGSELLGSAIKCSFTFYAHALGEGPLPCVSFGHGILQ